MAGNDDEALHEFITARYGDLRRSAFLMCGDWSVAAELTEAALARFVTESARAAVEDPDAYVYAELMLTCQKSRPRREHLFVAPEKSDLEAVHRPEDGAGDSAAQMDASHAAEPGVISEPEGSSGDGAPSRGESRPDGEAVRSERGQESTGGEVGAESVQGREAVCSGRDQDSAGGGVAEPGEPGASGGAEQGVDGPVDPIRTILVLDALHKLAPRCRAVMVLRYWDGFAVDETADILDLSDERVEAYESAGLAAMEKLLAEANAAVAA